MKSRQPARGYKYLVITFVKNKASRCPRRRRTRVIILLPRRLGLFRRTLGRKGICHLDPRGHVMATIFLCNIAAILPLVNSSRLSFLSCLGANSQLSWSRSFLAFADATQRERALWRQINAKLKRGDDRSRSSLMQIFTLAARLIKIKYQ
jgi:hypothetical protein